jgi:WS/DGAT/MGAT family acyltransferase
MERLSGLDATFLYVETPTMHMHVSLLALLEPSQTPGGYDRARLSALLERQTHAMPKLRRRLLQVPFGMHHPLWIDDPHFDVIHHIRHIACPAPGSMRELADLCGRINSTPLDRSRPLWELWLIEGLEGGKMALLAKVHHAMADGLTGAGLLSSLFSLSPSADPAPAKEPAHEAEPLPSEGQLLRAAIVDRFKASQQLGPIYKRTSEALHTLKARRRGGESSGGATPFLDAPRTRFNAPITAQRSAAFARLRLADLKLIRKAFGVSINDVVLAVCAGALRSYLEQKGELPAAPLIAACPVAVPPAGEGHGSNHVSAMFTSLATNLEDPVERLEAICRITRNAKEEHSMLGGETMGAWAELASAPLFSAGTRMYSKLGLAARHRPMHNVTISNVPGPPVPIYLAGAKLTAAYPMGPVMEGAGLNITVMSYVDQVDFGFTAATVLVPDLHALSDQLEPSAAELLSLAKQRHGAPSHATEGT